MGTLRQQFAEYEEMINYSLKPEVPGEAGKKSLPPELITAVAARYDELLNFV